MADWKSTGTVKINAPGHTWGIFNPGMFSRIVEIFEQKVLEVHARTPIDAVAGCGNSGVPLAAALSLRLGIPMITVRKPGEQTVAFSSIVTGAIGAKSYVIVDDMISSGGTVNRIMDAIFSASGNVARPAAVILYNQRHEEDNDYWTTTSWKSQGERVKLVGMTDQDSRYINGSEARRPSGKQLDLFDWSLQEKVRKSGEMVEDAARRYMARAEAKARQLADQIVFVPTRPVFFMDIGKLPDIDPDPPMKLWVEKPRSNKPPKYQPPSWVVGKQYDRPKNSKPPRSAR